jgi:dTDP-4-dehydrorhamnose 3,5-epimerase
MKFKKTALEGVVVIELEPHVDERGSFARTFCAREFAAEGLISAIAQRNESFNPRRGTVRGLHYQVSPYGETKVVSCPRGAIYDVVIDIRPASPTFSRWLAFELSEVNRRALYVAEGFAHGFQTLSDDTLVQYQMTEFYHPESSRGVRHDDPSFGVAWPLPVTSISERDRTYPLWSERPAP